MKRILTFLLILTTIMLVACGNDTADDTTDDTGSNTSPINSEVTFSVEGTTEVSAEGNVSIFCDDGDGVFESFIEIGYLDGNSQFILSIPTDTTVGTIDLIGSDDTGANPGQATYLKYRSEDLTNYDKGTGELVIEEMPTAEGEQFIATLTAELMDDDGNTVNISATYDADAGIQSFDDCSSE